MVVGFYTLNALVQIFVSGYNNNPKTTIIPLVCIIILGMSKEIYLEYIRGLKDKRTNEAECQVLSGINDQDVT